MNVGLMSERVPSISLNSFIEYYVHLSKADGSKLKILPSFVSFCSCACLGKLGWMGTVIQNAGWGVMLEM